MSLVTSSAKWAVVGSSIAFLAACSTVSHLDASTKGTSLAIRGIDRTELPRSEDLKSKATGQYEFMAITPEGKKVYGLLPLKVNGGTMAMSILFFAPALFIGGFRDAFPFYEIDPEKNVLRYKMKETDEWQQYHPLEVEAVRSKAYFDTVK